MLDYCVYEYVEGMDHDDARRLACWCRDYLEMSGKANEVGRSEFSKHYYDGICAGMRISLSRVDHFEVNVTEKSLRLISVLSGELVFEYQFGGDQK